MKDMINDLDFKAKIAEIENKMDQKWSGGEQRISGVEKKISGVDQKINGIEEFMIEILNIMKNNKWLRKLIIIKYLSNYDPNILIYIILFLASISKYLHLKI